MVGLDAQPRRPVPVETPCAGLRRAATWRGDPLAPALPRREGGERLAPQAGQIQRHQATRGCSTVGVGVRVGCVNARRIEPGEAEPLRRSARCPRNASEPKRAIRN